MEALAAVSLAASVIQFVTFTTKPTSTTKDFYTAADGTLAANAEAEGIAQSLTCMSDALTKSLESLGRNETLPAELASLRDIAQGSKIKSLLK